MRGDKHDWNSGDFPQSPFQVLVTGGNYESSELLDSAHNAVVRISPFVVANKLLESRILGKLNRHFVFVTQFLQLSLHAFRNVRDALSKQQIHRVLEYVQFVLNCHVDKVCIKENSVWRAEGGIVGEEEVAGLLRKLPFLDLQNILSFLVDFLFFF